jgi:hypothetical protein
MESCHRYMLTDHSHPTKVRAKKPCTGPLPGTNYTCTEVPKEFDAFIQSCWAPEGVGLSQYQPFCTPAHGTYDPTLRLSVPQIVDQFDLVMVLERQEESLVLFIVLFNFPASFGVKRPHTDLNIDQLRPAIIAPKFREELETTIYKTDLEIWKLAQVRLQDKVDNLTSAQRVRFKAVLEVTRNAEEVCTGKCRMGGESCFEECLDERYGHI